jgi:adenylate cyclase
MHSAFALRLVRTLLWPFAVLSERIGNRFYFGLAAIVVVLAVCAIVFGYTGGMKHQAYDFVMKSRFRVPPPDSDLVLIDIDEASLAAMAPEYGRWPWPRSVMAEVTEGIIADKPAAVVFDIVFSDLDVDHPNADRYFRDVVQRYPNTHFAMIRLNPDNDSASELRLAQLPGVKPLAAHASTQATVAMVVPYFWNVLYGMRMGTNNLYVDDDGIARSYHVYRDIGDWRMYSLPAAVVADLGGDVPGRSDILLNWRGRPPSYEAVSFFDVFTGVLGENARPSGRFTGKIVVIGSTAPSLFDLKPSPMAQNHPGVEILMTAIDNLKNRDYLTELPQWIYLLVTILAIVLLTAAFVYNVDPWTLYTLFTFMQTAFLGVTYLFLNYSTWFVDLTAPFTAALAYFFVARLYRRVLVGRRNGSSWYSNVFDLGRSSQALLLACRFRTDQPRRRRHIGGVLQREAGLTRFGAVAARPFAGAPLVDGIYDDTMLFYWLVPPEQTGAAMTDLLRMLERSVRGLQKDELASSVTLALHAHRFTVDEDASWRAAGKDAVIEVLQLGARSNTPFVVTGEFQKLRQDHPVAPSPTLQSQGFGP